MNARPSLAHHTLPTGPSSFCPVPAPTATAMASSQMSERERGRTAFHTHILQRIGEA